MYKSRGHKSHYYHNRHDPYGLCWYPYYGHGYGYGYGHGYHSWSSDDWSDRDGWSSDDDYGWGGDSHDHYDDCDMHHTAHTDVGEDELQVAAIETELGDADGVGSDDADMDGDGDLATVAAYAGAGPQRWWPGSGGGGGRGVTAVRVSRPRRTRTTRDDFRDWWDRTWWSKCETAFNTSILGRANPEDLRFKTEVFRSDTTHLHEHAITLVTQCSVDRLPQLEAQARAWRGAMSVAIFVQSPATDLPVIAELYARLSASTSLEIALVSSLAADGGYSEYERLYPINTLRNVAAEHARTELLFLVDVDFVPSRRLRKLASTQLWTASIAQHAAAGELTVIPAFEITPDAAVPSEQQDVLNQLNAGTAEGFHVSRFPKGHAPTNFGKWATASHRYDVSYEDCYEPYVIGNRHLLPKYDERFRGKIETDSLVHCALCCASVIGDDCATCANRIWDEQDPAALCLQRTRTALRRRATCIRRRSRTQTLRVLVSAQDQH
jgi:hypothetical protein